MEADMKSHYSGYQARVIQEFDELEIKRNKLKDFMTTLEFNELQHHQKELLARQSVIMDLYAEVLDERILNF